MMTFKQFHLQSSKGAKAPFRVSGRFRSSKLWNEISDRIERLKAAKCRSVQ